MTLSEPTNGQPIGARRGQRWTGPLVQLLALTLAMAIGLIAGVYLGSREPAGVPSEPEDPLRRIAELEARLAQVEAEFARSRRVDRREVSLDELLQLPHKDGGLGPFSEDVERAMMYDAIDNVQPLR